jgi:hypothetical protein
VAVFCQIISAKPPATKKKQNVNGLQQAYNARAAIFRAASPGRVEPVLVGW